jgi:hypothetical protein
MVSKHGIVGNGAMVALHGAVAYGAMVFCHHQIAKCLHYTSKMTGKLNSINRGLQTKHKT